jgi:hypothetical protein
MVIVTMAVAIVTVTMMMAVSTMSCLPSGDWLLSLRLHLYCPVALCWDLLALCGGKEGSRFVFHNSELILTYKQTRPVCVCVCVCVYTNTDTPSVCVHVYLIRAVPTDACAVGLLDGVLYIGSTQDGVGQGDMVGQTTTSG